MYINRKLNKYDVFDDINFCCFIIIHKSKTLETSSTYYLIMNTLGLSVNFMQFFCVSDVTWIPCQ